MSSYAALQNMLTRFNKKSPFPIWCGGGAVRDSYWNFYDINKKKINPISDIDLFIELPKMYPDNMAISILTELGCYEITSSIIKQKYVAHAPYIDTKCKFKLPKNSEFATIPGSLCIIRTENLRFNFWKDFVKQGSTGLSHFAIINGVLCVSKWAYHDMYHKRLTAMHKPNFPVEINYCKKLSDRFGFDLYDTAGNIIYKKEDLLNVKL